MSRKEQFKARDKKTHKMTRDGLVEVNQTTGTEQRVSQRGQEFELRRQAPAGRDTGSQAPPGFAETSGRGRRQPAPPSGEPPQTVPQEDGGRYSTHASDDRQTVAEYGQSTNTAAPLGDHSQSAPVRSGENRLPDAPLRATSHRAHTQTAATGADAQDGKRRHKQKQTQAAAYQESDAARPIAARQEDTLVHPASSAHRGESGENSAQNDTARQMSVEHSSRLQFGETEQAPAGRERQTASVRQHGTKYQRKFASETAKEGGDATGPVADRTQAGNPQAANQRPGSAKLQFAADEKPPEALGSKLTKARRKAERVDSKLEKAQGKLPTRRRARINRVYDEKKDKPVRKLHIEKEVKSRRAHLKGPLPLRPFKAGANAVIGYGHKKIYQVQHENVGIQAAHKGEIMAEGLARSAYRFHKTRPYRRVAKLERAATKAHIKLDYQKVLHDNPNLKSNALSRLIQKQKIKRKYAKAARDAKKAVSRTKKAGETVTKMARAVTGFVRRHPVAVGVAVLLLLLFLIIMTTFSSCGSMAGGGFSAIFMSSYLAEDKDIDDAELVYTEWETDLLLQVQNAERDRPGYDEYRYNVADVSHDPFELMAYLTARYQDFTFSEVQAELRAIFDEQYTLEFVEEIEVRYRTETRTDPETGEDYEVEVPYDWYILHINLTARSFSDVVLPRMTDDEREMFDLYMETRGNRQYALSPFAFDWLPYVSCYYGYRIHPITGEQDYHKAVDIAVAAGTDILATHDGTVTTATWHDNYGYYVALETTTETGQTLVTKYAHCSQLLVSAGQQIKKGDVIAKVGSTGDSTGAHLHFEVIVNGQYLNPLYFAEGAKGGELAPGTPGGPEFPEYPGAPMDDARFAAMMEEAQKHLNKPYVFGASGPNSFDCSGFVSYVLANSIYPGFGRATAQGIYNQCTPVSPGNAQPGDLVFFHSTYSTTSPTSHIGIYIGNGMMIHAGNPVQYESIETRYWQDHFYAFSRLP